MENDFESEEWKKELVETFELVKDTVRKTLGNSRGGLMLGLQELGATPAGFVGGYYPVSSNIIVMNKTPLRRIRETNPELLKPYTFHILLHEYIHALGVLDERAARQLTYEVCRGKFGEGGTATQLSVNIHKFFPNLVYPFYGWELKESESPVELVRGFDRSSSQSYVM